MRAALLVLLLAGCATTAPIAPVAPTKPVYSLPPDLQLVCYQGSWAVISKLAEMGAIFDQACVQA